MIAQGCTRMFQAHFVASIIMKQRVAQENNTRRVAPKTQYEG
jgi:hypothetical protein